MSLRSFRAAYAVALGATLSACSLLFAISDDAAAGRGDGGSGTDGSATPNEGGSTDTDGGVEAGIACPQGKPGPPLVAAERFCIDRTEVSSAQYAAFLAADKSALSLPPECTTGTDYDAALPAPSPDHPVLVEWCAAYAYCQWAGKRLCGAFDGGAVLATITPPDPILDRHQSEWLWACESGEHGYAYPYGNDYEPDACAPLQTRSPGEAPSYYGLTSVGTHPDCVGGYPDLLDMSGNAIEWINGKLLSLPGSDGGPVFYAMGQGPDCRTPTSPLSPHTLATHQNAYGFRCCFSP